MHENSNAMKYEPVARTKEHTQNCLTLLYTVMEKVMSHDRISGVTQRRIPSESSSFQGFIFMSSQRFFFFCHCHLWLAHYEPNSKSISGFL